MTIKEFVRKGIPSEIVLQLIEEKILIYLSSAATKKPSGTHACRWK